MKTLFLALLTLILCDCGNVPVMSDDRAPIPRPIMKPQQWPAAGDLGLCYKLTMSFDRTEINLYFDSLKTRIVVITYSDFDAANAELVWHDALWNGKVNVSTDGMGHLSVEGSSTLINIKRLDTVK